MSVVGCWATYTCSGMEWSTRRECLESNVWNGTEPHCNECESTAVKIVCLDYYTLLVKQQTQSLNIHNLYDLGKKLHSLALILAARGDLAPMGWTL